MVGESGSGKSTLAQALLGLLPGATVTGTVVLGEQSVLDLAPSELRALRGSAAAIVFQDAFAALNPLHRVGNQVSEAIRTHQPQVTKRDGRSRSVELLRSVGIADPGVRAHQYPHELSGGMRQRAAIAMAIANNPDVLIADEATTALDSTTQAQILELLEASRARTNAAMMLITHDFGIVAANADRVLVLYAGRAVEIGRVTDVMRSPIHPYTRGLLGSIPRHGRRGRRLTRVIGSPPQPSAVPSGCPFHPRCPIAEVPGQCSSVSPVLRHIVGTEQWAACHLAERIVAGGEQTPATT